MIRIDAMVVADEVSEAETDAMNAMPASMIMTAIAMTYPKIGLTVSSNPILSPSYY